MTNKPTAEENKLSSMRDKQVQDRCKESTKKSAKKAQHDFAPESPSQSEDVGESCCLMSLPGLRSVASPRKRILRQDKKTSSCVSRFSRTKDDLIITPNDNNTQSPLTSGSEAPNDVSEPPYESRSEPEMRQQNDRAGAKKNTDKKNDEQMNKLIDLLAEYKWWSSVVKQKVRPRLSDSNPPLASLAERPQSAAFGSGTQLLTCGRGQLIGDQFYLEDSWRSFVKLPSSPASEKHETGFCGDIADKSRSDDNATMKISNLCKQQNAIWELLITEVSYIKRLQVIIDLFQATLTRLQRDALLKEVNARQLFGNINEVYEANRLFWTNHLLAMLKEARSTGEPMDPRMLKTAINEVRNIFNPYSEYCLSLSSCLDYARDTKENNEYFKIYTAWCERQKDCDRLELKDLMAEPMQRLTKYKIMLEGIAKRTEDPMQLICLNQLKEKMDDFASEVNSKLKSKEDLDRLLAIADQLDHYELGTDVYTDEVDQLAKKYCRLDLMAPIFGCQFNCRRRLLFNSQEPERDFNFGQLRFKDPLTNGKIDITLLIFTDQLVVCKQSTHSSRWVHRQRSMTASASNSFTRRANLNARRSTPVKQIHCTGSHSSTKSIRGGEWWGMQQAPIRADSNLLTPNSREASNQSLQQLDRTSLSHQVFSSNQTSAFGSPDSSLSGSMLKRRTEFARSNDSSADYQLDAEIESRVSSVGPKSDKCSRRNLSSKPDNSILRAIRPPYPIDKLRVHEFNGGLGLFFCQLNENQTISNSFCIYFRQSASMPPSTSPGGTPARSAGVGFTDLRDLCPKDYTNAPDISDSFILDRDSALRQANPALRLKYLINLALQLMHQSADFHHVDLGQVKFSPIHELTQKRSNEELIQLGECDHSRWSLGTMHLRGDKPLRSRSDESEEKQTGYELAQSCSASCESCTEITYPKRRNPVVSALALQLKSMVLNHGQPMQPKIASLSPFHKQVFADSKRHIHQQAGKTISSPGGIVQRSSDLLSPFRHRASSNALGLRKKIEFKKELCSGNGITRNIEEKIISNNTGLYAYDAQDKTSKSSLASGLSGDFEDSHSSDGYSTQIDGRKNQFSVDRSSSQLTRKLANPLEKKDVSHSEKSTPSRKHLSRQDINVGSMDPCDWNLSYLQQRETITNDESESSTGGSERTAFGARFRRHFLTRKNVRRTTADSSLGTATMDQATSAVFDSSYETPEPTHSDNQRKNQRTEVSMLSAASDLTSERTVSIESGHLADCESGKKRVVRAITTCDRTVNTARVRSTTSVRSASVKSRSPPTVLLTQPDHYPTPAAGSRYASNPVFLHPKRNGYSATNGSAIARENYRASLSPIPSVASIPISILPINVESLHLKRLGTSSGIPRHQQDRAGEQSSSKYEACDETMRSNANSGYSPRHPKLPEWRIIASTSSSQSSNLSSLPACTDDVSTKTTSIEMQGVSSSRNCIKMRPTFKKGKVRDMIQRVAKIFGRRKLSNPSRMRSHKQGSDASSQETNIGFVDGTRNSTQEYCSSPPSTPISLNPDSDDEEVFEVYGSRTGAKSPPVYFGFHEKIRIHQEKLLLLESKTGGSNDRTLRAESFR